MTAVPAPHEATARPRQTPERPKAEPAAAGDAAPLAEPGRGKHGGPIVLDWLIRLRWLAVAGQVLAIALAVLWLGLEYPLGSLATVIALTVVSNVGLVLWRRWWGELTPVALPAGVLLADVGLLTALLYYTGGPANPFAVLYAVHVTMATVVLGPHWAWVTVAVVAACYGLLLIDSRPLAPNGVELSQVARDLGRGDGDAVGGGAPGLLHRPARAGAAGTARRSWRRRGSGRR